MAVRFIRQDVIVVDSRSIQQFYRDAALSPAPCPLPHPSCATAAKCRLEMLSRDYERERGGGGRRVQARTRAYLFQFFIRAPNLEANTGLSAAQSPVVADGKRALLVRKNSNPSSETVLLPLSNRIPSAGGRTTKESWPAGERGRGPYEPPIQA